MSGIRRLLQPSLLGFLKILLQQFQLNVPRHARAMHGSEDDEEHLHQELDHMRKEGENLPVAQVNNDEEAQNTIIQEAPTCLAKQAGSQRIRKGLVSMTVGLGVMLFMGYKNLANPTFSPLQQPQDTSRELLPSVVQNNTVSRHFVIFFHQHIGGGDNSEVSATHVAAVQSNAVSRQFEMFTSILDSLLHQHSDGGDNSEVSAMRAEPLTAKNPTALTLYPTTRARLSPTLGRVSTLPTADKNVWLSFPDSTLAPTPVYANAKMLHFLPVYKFPMLVPLVTLHSDLQIGFLHRFLALILESQDNTCLV